MDNSNQEPVAKSFNSAMRRAKQKAREFIGAPVSEVVDEDFGGTPNDQKINSFLIDKSEKVSPHHTLNIDFEDDEEGDGTVELTFFDVSGLKFVRYDLDEGGPSNSGATFFLAATKYRQLSKQ